MSKISLKNLNLRRLSVSLFKNLPAHEKRITLSTVFTLLRIVLAPFIVVAMVMHMWGVAFWLFLIAAFSDIVDGNLARLCNEKTFLGACLDPLADKILLISCFFTLAFVEGPLFTVPLWFVILVLIKDLAIVFGALTIYLIKGHLEVHPTYMGKLATVVQSYFIIWLFACYFFNWMPIKIYYTILGIMIFLVIGTLLQYIKMGFSQWNASS